MVGQCPLFFSQIEKRKKRLRVQVYEGVFVCAESELKFGIFFLDVSATLHMMMPQVSVTPTRLTLTRVCAKAVDYPAQSFCWEKICYRERSVNMMTIE